MLHWRPLLPPLFCNSSLRSALNAYNFSALPQRNQIQLLCWCTSRSLTPFPRLETLLKTHSTLSIFHAYISNFPGDDTGIISLVKMGHDPLWPFDSDSMDCFTICDSSDCLVRPPSGVLVTQRGTFWRFAGKVPTGVMLKINQYCNCSPAIAILRFNVSTKI